MHIVRSFLLSLLLPLSARAAVVVTTSLDALQKAVAAAGPGDEIVLKNGTYTASAALTFSGVAGTETKSVVIRAETVGGATIAGRTAVVIDKSAHVRLSGFRFTFQALADKGVQVKASHHVEIRDNHFELAETTLKNYWLVIDGAMVDGTAPHHVTIARNAFRNKTQEGCFVVVYGRSSPYGIARNVTIEGNLFKGHSFAGSNGGEAIRFGDSNRQNDPTDSEIRGNLFEDCDGDVEVVSVKSTRLKVWGNTLRSNQGSIVLRHGDSCQVVGNFLLGNIGGIRIYGDNQAVVGNHLAGNTNLKPDGSVSSSYATLGIGMGSQADLADGENTYDQPSGGIVAFNTLVDNNSRGLEVVKIKTETFAPTAMGILNNVVVSDKGSLSTFAAAPTSATIDGNLLFGKATAGDLARTFSADPLLVEDADGIRRPSAGSPVVDAAVRPSLVPSWYTADIDGQTRSGAFDLGADERLSSPVSARPLQAPDVGPGTGRIPVGSSREAPVAAGSRAASLELFDLSGRRMASWADRGPVDPSKLLAGMRPGTYVVRVQGQGVVRSSVVVAP